VPNIHVAKRQHVRNEPDIARRATAGYDEFMNILFKQFVLGFVIETLASLDDMLTTIPLMVAATRSRFGKILFAIGSMLGVAAVALLAAALSPLIGQIPYFRYIIAAVIFLLAALVYFERLSRIFQHSTRVISAITARQMDADRYLSLLAFGFLTSFFTLMDDAVAFIPLFAQNHLSAWFAAGGIMLSAVVQTIVLIFLAEQIERFKYRRHITAAGLLLYGLLLLFGVI